MCAINLGLRLDDLKAISAGTFYDMLELRYPSEDMDD